MDAATGGMQINRRATAANRPLEMVVAVNLAGAEREV
jgi:hypothetical protein